jgi:hypothetical protein
MVYREKDDFFRFVDRLVLVDSLICRCLPSHPARLGSAVLRGLSYRMRCEWRMQ